MIDLFTISSVIVNAILAFVTIMQLRVYRREVKYRLRAWVGRKNEPNGSVIQLNNSSKAISISLYNHGQLPAMNVRIKSYRKDSKPDNDDDVFGALECKIPPFDLLPGEIISFEISLTEEQFDKARTEKLYYGLKATYDISKNISRRSKNKNDGFYELRGYWCNGKETSDKIIVG